MIDNIAIVIENINKQKNKQTDYRHIYTPPEYRRHAILEIAID